MKIKLILTAALIASMICGYAHAGNAKKDHPYLKITCNEYLDYEPEDLTRVYYWYDAYSWFTWNDPIIEEDDYVDWHANLVTYCTDNKGNLIVDAIQQID